MVVSESSLGAYVCHRRPAGLHCHQRLLPYQKLHLRKRLVVLVLLKTSKLVSKFENPTPGAESSSFLQQRGRFLDKNDLGRKSTCSSLLAVERTAMVFNALEINSYDLGKKLVQMQKGLVDERSTHCGVPTQRRSHHRITGLAIQWRCLGAGMQRLASAVPQLQHERSGACRQNKGFPNLAILHVTNFSPLPEQNDDLRFCLP